MDIYEIAFTSHETETGVSLNGYEPVVHFDIDKTVKEWHSSQRPNLVKCYSGGSFEHIPKVELGNAAEMGIDCVNYKRMCPSLNEMFRWYERNSFPNLVFLYCLFEASIFLFLLAEADHFLSCVSFFQLILL
ncbi:hypothetical protein AVEN_136463-1 [Araneus ventricosus]|uniref:Uncharacterized protein n=1 Tax=Araneus ventricosus TaxID=182803 RepID=A0A4Y2DWV2_ARAVE|nr:hypothetical protein AVEN_80526-1 [Araneus ventricosus]GBM91732.1 hypothetical protein AVEN_136463-1 [Araneus ventricosus]